MTFSSFKLDAPRLPRENIPKDYKCPEPYCGAGPFKNQAGIVGHMASKHRILYEKVAEADRWYENVDPDKIPD